jgi:hypothetical protein
VTGDRRPLRAPLRAWLERTMEAGEPADAPWTIDEARHALDALLASDGYLATPTGLTTLLQGVKRYFAGSDLDAPASAPPAPSPSHLRLVPPAPAPEPQPATTWLPPLAAARDLVAARTEGALAVATAFPAVADRPDESFAPEAGVSFPPDEPEPEPIVAAPPLPPPPARPASGAVPVAVADLSMQGSGAVPVAGPLADSLAAPPRPVSGSTAASIARDSLADLVHTRPGRTEGSGAHRVASGSVRATHSMFDSDDMLSRHAGKSSLPLKLAGAAGLVGALAVGGWLIFGGSPAAEKPSDRTRQSDVQAQPAAPPAAAPVAEASVTPAPAGRETLPASLAGAAAAAEEAGSLQLETPFQLEVFEEGVRLGTSDAPIVLAAGRHQLELANLDYAFRGRQVVDVRPGRGTRVTARLPSGLANINATPWAEVWIDGTRAGDTPLGNLSLTIGPHEVVFRHPQLGEQTRTLVVTAGAATRLSVEMQQ